ncbi:hypothetical protein P8C59_007900 [Phyllachora maydis]|uniref:Arginine N-methyltransferase 2 n=1 Tax=Phyllachora maydis TaxID=1825666 RepID=A0AAD9I9M6_9PEZI|nr:hypothetical protein P8C59_007900 [Phyllachora maydis]
MDDLDSISTRISSACPPDTQRILTAAWAHDVATVKRLLDAPGRARAQDPVTGETPLHAAIRACGPAGDDDADAAAAATVRELLQWGAIWNDLDDHGETPGCVAWRLGRRPLYDLCVAAGTRAEMLFGLLDGYEALSSGEEDEEGEAVDGAVAQGSGQEAPELFGGGGGGGGGAEKPTAPETVDDLQEPRFLPPTSDADGEVKSENYLRSKLTYSDGKLVDDEGNGVMMAWETDIMRQSVDTLIPDKATGKRILNIGFGMGIIDSMLAETKPSVHQIIEAHADVLDRASSSPHAKFGASWEASGPEPGAYKMYRGKWQEVCPTLIAQGRVFDAIYFDTFGEGYGQLRNFFTEIVPALLDQHGIFGFFNGLGADRRICHDVYTDVVEMHLGEAGLDVNWKVVPVDMSQLAQEGQGEWEGVKRRYWTLDEYRLPVCTFSA